MTNSRLEEQASEIAELLPRMLRGLFVLDAGDPDADLPVGQLRVCGILRHGPKNLSSLGKALGISLSAVTQIGHRLERAGLAQRYCEAGDRRVKSLKLTPYGEQVMANRNRKRTERIAQVLALMKPEERENLVTALRQTIDASSGV